MRTGQLTRKPVGQTLGVKIQPHKLNGCFTNPSFYFDEKSLPFFILCKIKGCERIFFLFFTLRENNYKSIVNTIIFL